MNAIAQPAARAAVSLPAARPSFAGAVRSELLKIRRQALTWVLLSGGVLVTGIALATIAASGDLHRTLDRDPLSFYFTYLTAMQSGLAAIAGVFLLVTGSRLVSMEYGSGTIRVVLARGTSRLGLLAAQYAALAIAGVLLFAGFAVVAAGFLYGLVVAWHGSFTPIASLPGVAWTDTGWNALAVGVSMCVCILLGSAAAVVGRSVAFGVGVGVGFFPADNFAVIVMALMSRVTHQDFWPKLTQFFLGPALNQLPAALQTDHPTRPAFATPLVHVDVTHAWLVIGAYAFVFLAASLILTRRRDVLH